MPELSLRQLEKNLAALWPAAKGSLALVYKPCTRPSCPACARGDKHPAYILSFSQGKKRRCMYVPKALVSKFKKLLSNGRKMERLLYSVGPRVLHDHRHSQPSAKPKC